MVRIERRYIALIADVVGSRSVPRIQRRALQHRFTHVIDDFNLKYSKMIAAKFGLLNSAAVVPDLIWRLEEDLPGYDFRVGIGAGTLDRPAQKYAINIDGPALHMARSAIESAKKTGTLGGVFPGFGELDDILNGIARLLWFQRSRWTRAQRRIAGLLRQGMSQTQVAKKLRIRKQVVSRQVLSSGYFPYAAGDWAWRMILDKQVDPLLRSKHGFSQRR